MGGTLVVAVSVDIGGVPEGDAHICCTGEDFEVLFFCFCGTVEGRHAHCSESDCIVNLNLTQGRLLAETDAPVLPSLRVG